MDGVVGNSGEDAIQGFDQNVHGEDGGNAGERCSETCQRVPAPRLRNAAAPSGISTR